jgi:hypothetical protein
MATSAGNFWEASKQAASTKGWSVYTAAGTPYDQQEALGTTFVRIHNASYPSAQYAQAMVIKAQQSCGG